MTGSDFPEYSLDEVLTDHASIAAGILQKINPFDYFKDYLHHGFYPFFLENRNFSENLLKTMNMMIEVDILLIKQIDLAYLTKIRKLLYILGQNAPCVPNISQLSNDVSISRATVMNYIKYLKDARLIDLLYPVGEQFPKKPSKVYLHNTNLMYVLQETVDHQTNCETFFYNTVHKDNKVNRGPKAAQFILNGNQTFQISAGQTRLRSNPVQWQVVDNWEVGKDKVIPLWLFGFLY
jgi:predicted AAA+ superfamily ATPase